MIKTKKALDIPASYGALLYEKVQQLAGQFEDFLTFAISWRDVSKAARQTIVPQVVGQFQKTQSKYFFVGVII